ncbi:WYL domain-containing protein, partial [Paraburkholderia sp. SIMBA_055]
QSGVRKIRALGIDGDEPIIGFAPRITARDAAFAPLQDAIERCRVVAFDYLKPGEDAPRRRRIRPLALVDYEARWHVFGIDVDVEED